MKYQYHVDGTLPTSDEIFVFGSNLAGRHGAGAAKVATKFGAVYGVGYGLAGNSFAIPTKDIVLDVLPLPTIQAFVDDFLKFARMTFNTQKFFMTRIGCGLAGYYDEQIAPMFRGAPVNINFPENWKPFLED